MSVFITLHYDTQERLFYSFVILKITINTKVQNLSNENVLNYSEFLAIKSWIANQSLQFYTQASLFGRWKAKAARAAFTVLR